MSYWKVVCRRPRIRISFVLPGTSFNIKTFLIISSLSLVVCLVLDANPFHAIRQELSSELARGDPRPCVMNGFVCAWIVDPRTIETTELTESERNEIQRSHKRRKPGQLKLFSCRKLVSHISKLRKPLVTELQFCFLLSVLRLY